MASLTLSAKDVATVTADAVVLAVAKGSDGPRLVQPEGLPAPLRASLSGAIAALGVTGAPDDVTRVPSFGHLLAPVVVLTGLGAPPARGAAWDAEVLRRGAGAATRELAGTARVAVWLPVEGDGALAAVCEGALLGAYAFRRYRSTSAAATKEPVGAVVVLTPRARTSTAKAVAARAAVLAQAVHGTRDLVNTAPVDLYPAAFAQEATRAVDGLPVQVTVLDERKLARGGYGGILGVGMGSARPPRLVRLDYAPDGARGHVALVGKGITFDSGGLSIKPAAGMEAMKSDMAGAAAVLHTVAAVARLRLPLRVSGWLALAENMPSGTAQRPSDVLTVRGGRTVEVLNTDAEGRLVLADALVAAGETGPDVIVDVATLTGAQTVALGHRTSAIMSNDDRLRDRVHRLATAAGEQFWPMPLPPELRASMDSAVADIANIGDRFGGMLVAGLFLKEFVANRPGVDGDGGTPAGAPGAGQTGVDQTGAGQTGAGQTGAGQSGGGQIPWAHLDIAGPAFNTGKPFGYTPVGGTGVAVRTLLALSEDLAGGE